MTSEFDKLFNTITESEPAAEGDLLTEDIISRIADWADSLQTQWHKLKGTFSKEKSIDDREDIGDKPEGLTIPGKEKIDHAERYFQDLSDFLESIQTEDLSPDELSEIAAKAQKTLNIVTAILGSTEGEIPELRSKITKLLTKYLGGKTMEGEPAPIPVTSAAMTKVSRPPSIESKMTKLEALKKALKDARQVLGMKYDILDRRASWGNKLIMVLMILGLVKQIKFD